MKMDIQYISDSAGKTQSIILPISHWEKVVKKMEKYEQALKIKADLIEGFVQVEKLRSSKTKKQTLSDFLLEI